MAEPARDPAVANFCHYFRPRPDAYTQDKKTKSDDALDKLRALFGDTDENTDNDATAEQKSDSQSAKDRFDSLFKDDS